MFTKTKQYDTLTAWYSRAHKSKSKAAIQAEVNVLWHSVKKSKKGAIDEEKYNSEIEKLKTRVKELEGGTQSSISSFLKKKVVGETMTNKNDEGQDDSNSGVTNAYDYHSDEVVGDVEEHENNDLVNLVNDKEYNNNNDTRIEAHETETEFETPKQDKLRNEILEKESALGKLLDAKNLGLENETVENINKRIKSLKQEIEGKKKELKRKEAIQKAVKKFRNKKKKS